MKPDLSYKKRILIDATTVTNITDGLSQYIINLIKNFNDKNLQDLLECCQLPNWRSAKWSKEFLQTILKNEKIKSDYQRILPNLNQDNQFMIKRFLLN